AKLEVRQELDEVGNGRFLETEWLAIRPLLQPVGHVLDELGHRLAEHGLDLRRRLGHALRRLLALLLPDLPRNGFQLIRHADADVLPRKAKLACDIFNPWVVSGIVETA